MGAAGGAWQGGGGWGAPPSAGGMLPWLRCPVDRGPTAGLKTANGAVAKQVTTGVRPSRRPSSPRPSSLLPSPHCACTPRAPPQIQSTTASVPRLGQSHPLTVAHPAPLSWAAGARRPCPLSTDAGQSRAVPCTRRWVLLCGDRPRRCGRPLPPPSIRQLLWRATRPRTCPRSPVCGALPSHNNRQASWPPAPGTVDRLFLAILAARPCFAPPHGGAGRTGSA